MNTDTQSRPSALKYSASSAAEPAAVAAIVTGFLPRRSEMTGRSSIQIAMNTPIAVMI